MKHLSNVARMRTIDEAYAEIKFADNHTAITKNFIRRLVISGNVPSIKAGRKYLINMDTLEDYLYNGLTVVNDANSKIGVIRPIAE